jgi:hypothetical protein
MSPSGHLEQRTQRCARRLRQVDWLDQPPPRTAEVAGEQGPRGRRQRRHLSPRGESRSWLQASARLLFRRPRHRSALRADGGAHRLQLVFYHFRVPIGRASVLKSQFNQKKREILTAQNQRMNPIGERSLTRHSSSRDGTLATSFISQPFLARPASGDPTVDTPRKLSARARLVAVTLGHCVLSSRVSGDRCPDSLLGAMPPLQ